MSSESRLFGIASDDLQKVFDYRYLLLKQEGRRGRVEAGLALSGMAGPVANMNSIIYPHLR